MAMISDQERDDLIAVAILEAREEAKEIGGPISLGLCVGRPCPGDSYGCVMCEVITVHPTGIVSRETKSN